jgi:hypothetical protein
MLCFHAPAEQAQEVHADIRKWLAGNVSAGAAAKIRIIYGGSVTSSNCSSLAAQVSAFIATSICAHLKLANAPPAGHRWFSRWRGFSQAQRVSTHNSLEISRLNSYGRIPCFSLLLQLCKKELKFTVA